MTEFETNLLKLIAGELYFISCMDASREMLGKNYFSLGVAEKASIDQVVLGAIGSNFQSITPELLKGQQAGPVAGFQAGPQTTNR
jgi:hypothetical protein